MAKVLLKITTSINGDHSISNSVCDAFVGAWKEKNADATIVERNLATDPVPHLDAEAIYAGYTPEENRSDGMKSKMAARMVLIEELKAATDVVIATPMWNWNVPSGLKAWIDSIVMPGVMAPGMGLLEGKKFTFCCSQGGSYTAESGKGGWDYMTGYLVMVPKALGAKESDIDLILVEFGLAGIAPGMEGLVDAKEKSIAAAKEKAIARGAV